MFKKLIFAAPAVAAVSSFASTTSWNSQEGVTSVTSDLVTYGGYVITAVGTVIAVVAGLRMLVKGVNRAVGK